MANTVQISITVDNQQASSALGATTSQIMRLSAASSTLGSTWTGMENGLVATTRGVIQLGESVKQTSGHVATSRDGVRLLSQEFGLNLPRALESIISRMPALSAAIGGAMTGLAGFAVAEVLYRVGDAVYNLYNKYISLSAAAEAYNNEVQKHKDEDFINPHSIETATDRIKGTTEAAKDLIAQGEKLRDKSMWEINPVNAIGDFFNARYATELGYKSKTQGDAMDPRRLSMQHDLNVMQIESAHAADGELRGQQKINAELQKRLDLNRENQNYTRSQDAIQQGGASRSSGQQKRDLEDAQARSEAGAQRVELERQITNKTVTLQNEATNAALVGNQLLTAQKLQAEDEIRRSGIGTAQQIAAIELKYHNEQMKRLKEEQDAVDKRAHTEAEAGLSTYAKVQAQGQDRLSDIDDKAKKGLYADQQKPGDPSALADKDRATANAEMYREMTDAQKKFEEEQQAALDRSTSEQLGAFSKIDTELQQRLQKRADEYTKFYGTIERNSAAVAQLTAANDADEAAAARQVQQVEQTIRDQTLQKDREAAQAEARGRADGLADWQAKYREIEAAHTAMIAKINTEEQKPGVTKPAHDDYERQKVDADRVANAQIEDANQQLAHSIAGTLESAFDSPIQVIQKKFEKMFFDLAASWLAHSGIFGQVAGGGGPGESVPGGGGGGRFGIGSIAHSFLAGGGLGGGGLAASAPTGAPGGGATAAAAVATAASGFGASPIGQAMQHLGLRHPASTVPPAPSQSSAIATPSIASTVTSTGMGATSSAAATLSQGTPSTGRYGFSGAASTSSPASDYSFPLASTAGGSYASSPAAALSGPSSLASPAASSAPGSTPIGASSSSTGIDAARSSITSSASSVGSLATTGANALNASGNAGTVSAGMSAAGSLVGAGVGAFTGFQGVLGGFEAGSASGVLSATMGGAELGGSIGMLAGPLGSAIGAGIGAIGGAAIGIVGDVTGEGNRLGAAAYFKDKMRPQFEQAAADYFSGAGGDAEAALGNVASIGQSGERAIAAKFGGTAAGWTRTHYIDKEQKVVTGEIRQLAAGGHDYVKTSAVQFHGGGTIRGFGDLATSGNEGFVHAMLGEQITNPAASRTHGQYIDAMNSGASESEIAGMYLRNSSGASAAPQSGGDTHHHRDVQTMDAHSFRQFLEERGGMDAIVSSNTRRNAMYNGEAD